MAKKPDLGEALRHAAGRPATPPPLSPSPPVAQPRTKHFRPSRQGTKTIAGHFDPAAAKQMKQLAIDQESSVQELLREAINDLFAKNGLPPLA